MIDWTLPLVAVAPALPVLLLRFIGCGLDVVGSAPAPYNTPIMGTADLVAYWRLGEATCGAGATAKDEKAAHDGTYTTATLSAAQYSATTPTPGSLACGRPGLLIRDSGAKCIEVDGGYVRVSHAAALNPPKFTVEAWVRPTGPATETGIFHCILASREDTTTAKHGYILYAGPILDIPTNTIVDPVLHWQAWVGNGTEWKAAVGPRVAFHQEKNEFHRVHLAATYDGTTLKLYVDGPNDEAGTPDKEFPTGYSPNPGKPLYIGMGAPERAVPSPGPLYPFRGRLQEVAVYKRALGHEEILAHAVAGN